jgi:hypothetical protein
MMLSTTSLKKQIPSSNTPKKMKKKNIKSFSTLIVATSLIAVSYANSATVFSANFDGTTVADIGSSNG